MVRAALSNGGGGGGGSADDDSDEPTSVSDGMSDRNKRLRDALGQAQPDRGGGGGTSDDDDDEPIDFTIPGGGELKDVHVGTDPETGETTTTVGDPDADPGPDVQPGPGAIMGPRPGEGSVTLGEFGTGAPGAAAGDFETYEEVSGTDQFEKSQGVEESEGGDRFRTTFDDGETVTGTKADIASEFEQRWLAENTGFSREDVRVVETDDGFRTELTSSGARRVVRRAHDEADSRFRWGDIGVDPEAGVVGVGLTARGEDTATDIARAEAAESLEEQLSQRPTTRTGEMAVPDFRFFDEPDVDIGREDVRQTDEGTWTLTDDALLSVGAARFQAQGIDVTTADIELEDGNVAISLDARRDLAADDISRQIGEDVAPTDLVRTEDGWRLSENKRRALASDEIAKNLRDEYDTDLAQGEDYTVVQTVDEEGDTVWRAQFTAAGAGKVQLSPLDQTIEDLETGVTIPFVELIPGVTEEDARTDIKVDTSLQPPTGISALPVEGGPGAPEPSSGPIAPTATETDLLTSGPLLHYSPPKGASLLPTESAVDAVEPSTDEPVTFDDIRSGIDEAESFLQSADAGPRSLPTEGAPGGPGPTLSTEPVGLVSTGGDLLKGGVDIAEVAADVTTGAGGLAYQAATVPADQRDELVEQAKVSAQRVPFTASAGLIRGFREDPAGFSGRLAGSLIASFGIMGAAARIGPRAGLASRLAIQPGEEALGAGLHYSALGAGRAVGRPEAGQRAADIVAPRMEPIFLSEEFAIRQARRGIGRGRELVRGRLGRGEASDFQVSYWEDIHIGRENLEEVQYPIMEGGPRMLGDPMAAPRPQWESEQVGELEEEHDVTEDLTAMTFLAEQRLGRELEAEAMSLRARLERAQEMELEAGQELSLRTELTTFGSVQSFLSQNIRSRVSQDVRQVQRPALDTDVDLDFEFEVETEVEAEAEAETEVEIETEFPPFETEVEVVGLLEEEREKEKRERERQLGRDRRDAGGLDPGWLGETFAGFAGVDVGAAFGRTSQEFLQTQAEETGQTFELTPRFTEQEAEAVGEVQSLFSYDFDTYEEGFL